MISSIWNLSCCLFCDKKRGKKQGRWFSSSLSNNLWQRTWLYNVYLIQSCFFSLLLQHWSNNVSSWKWINSISGVISKLKKSHYEVQKSNIGLLANRPWQVIFGKCCHNFRKLYSRVIVVLIIVISGLWVRRTSAVIAFVWLFGNIFSFSTVTCAHKVRLLNSGRKGSIFTFLPQLIRNRVSCIRDRRF